MKKVPLLIICFLASFNTLGQIKFENKLTDGHVNIAGTKISLIPPKGFTKASNFQGFQQNESGSSIMVVVIPGPFSQVSKGITKEGLLSRGIEVDKIEDVSLNDLPAVLATGKQNANGYLYTKYIFCFGTEKETTIINGAFPENLKELGNEVKKSLLSVVYEQDKKIDPLVHVDFQVDVANSKLTFAKSVANALLFTVDGNLPPKSADKTMLTVSKSLSQIAIEDKKLFALNRIKQLPVEIEKIESSDMIEIDGINGYEIVATAKSKKTAESEKVYQVILFSDNLYYILVGITNDLSGKSIDELRRVAGSFKRK
jgi:hypothetical protein